MIRRRKGEYCPLTGVACVLCHHHQVTWPAEVIPLEGGLVLQGPEADVKRIQAALIDRGLLEGLTPWQVALRLLSETLYLHSPQTKPEQSSSP